MPRQKRSVRNSQANGRNHQGKKARRHEDEDIDRTMDGTAARRQLVELDDDDLVAYDADLDDHDAIDLTGAEVGDDSDSDGAVDDDARGTQEQATRAFLDLFKQQKGGRAQPQLHTGNTLHGSRSERARFGAKQRALNEEARKPGQKSVRDYFQRRAHDPDTEDDMAAAAGAPEDAEADDKPDLYTIEQAIEALEPLADLNNSRAKDAAWQKNGYRMYHKIMALALLKYFELQFTGNKSKMKASAEVGEAIWRKKGEDTYKAKCVRKWGDTFLATGKLVTHKQGKHVKTFTVISDEHVQQKLTTYLRSMRDEDRYPRQFMEALNSGLLAEIPRAPATVCEKTALRWMPICGFSKEEGKGSFTDGHERPDVVEARLP